jgi:hypothetical protein
MEDDKEVSYWSGELSMFEDYQKHTKWIDMLTNVSAGGAEFDY